MALPGLALGRPLARLALYRPLCGNGWPLALGGTRRRPLLGTDGCVDPGSGHGLTRGAGSIAARLGI